MALYIPNYTEPEITEYVIKYPFNLDMWQKYAIDAIHKRHNVFVTAKTGSGKTLVGEYQIAFSLAEGKRVFYTTPIKSLTNQKFHDLKTLFPSTSVGIMTGDIKSNPDASIVVMTTEILRNLLFKRSTITEKFGTAGQLSLNDVGAVIFDEVHYINDVERGHVWEESILLMPPTINMILLSATIDSADLFGEWMAKIKGVSVALLQTTHRIVPLVHGGFNLTSKDLPIHKYKLSDEDTFSTLAYSNWISNIRKNDKMADDWAARVGMAKKTGESIAGATGKHKATTFTFKLNQMIEIMQKRDLLPALFFTFSRNDCKRYAEQVAATLLDSSEIAAVKHIITFHLHKYGLEHFPQYHDIIKLLIRGIAYHHSGMMPLLKEIVELLFVKGYVRVLFCTETFAVGLNMPTRTVVFLDLKKPDTDGFRLLRSDEYTQMAGRAGRRGKDTHGIVIYMPSKVVISVDEMAEIMSGKLPPLTSRLQFHYDLVLKTLHSGLMDTILENSYWSIQNNKVVDEINSEITTLTNKLAEISLTELEIEDIQVKLTLVNIAEISVNAEKRKAINAIKLWDESHPGWSDKIAKYTSMVKINERINTLKKYENTMPQQTIAAIKSALIEWGAIESDKLTEMGIMCTEINEVNPLILVNLYEHLSKNIYTIEDIVCCVGALCIDNDSIEKSQHPDKTGCSSFVKDTIYNLCDLCEKGYNIDTKFGINSPDNYWTINTLWCEIGKDWLNGMDTVEIIHKYEIQEGNLIKGMMKLINVIDELGTLAEYNANISLIIAINEISTKMARDIIRGDSLYLHLK